MDHTDRIHGATSAGGEAAVDPAASELALMLARTADVVVRARNDGVLLDVTPAVTTLLDWHPADLIGRPFVEIVHADDVDVVRAAEAKLDAGRSQRFEIRVRCRDRSYRHISVALRPAVDESGVIVGRLGGWKSSGGAPVGGPRDDGRILRTVIDHTREALTLADPDGRVVWSTTGVRDVFGWGATALLGRSVNELIHRDDFSAALPHLQAAFRLQDPVASPKDILARLVSPDGGTT